MIFRNYQKTFVAIGIVAIIIPLFFLAMPQKARATVPVIDSAAIAEITTANGILGAIEVTSADTAYNTGEYGGIQRELKALRKKEVGMLAPEVPGLSWDWVAYTAAGVALHAVTDSIVEWINNGFEGQPGFITDPEAFFTDAADQATGRFMKEFLSPEVYNFICSPFRIDLLLGLKRTNTYAERMRCTLSTVLANAQNGVEFGTGLRNGDWGDWMSATLSVQNNPGGAILISLDEMLGRQANARGTAKTESIFNAGFLSMKKCVEYYDNQWTGEHKCIKWTATSPGKWVSDTLGQATGIDMQRLAVADEINEILSALITQLLKGILQ